MHRRKFLQFSVAGAAGIGSTVPGLTFSGANAIAREPILRQGPTRFQIGLAAYSLRDYFSFRKGKDQTPKQNRPAIDMPGFIDYCADQGFDTCELTSYFFRSNADEKYFLNLKRHAYLRGITISGTAIGNNFTVGKGPQLETEISEAIAWIDRAAILGAPHIRFFAGTGKQLSKDPARLIEATDALNRCAEHAAKKGIFLGVENHGNLTAEQMLAIMDRTDNPWVGINLDTGNFLSEDPYRDLAICAPYAVNVQVKVNMKTPDGEHYPADLDRISQILKAANYQGFVILEYEDKDPYDQIPTTAAKLRAALA
ncbi:MAG: sugar phosphate isomerase/epimerase family protein [Planctomycetota bacterium]|nr:sugar phosphate isomerase/epimerase family protein [Planctomycetota bacterium]